TLKDPMALSWSPVAHKRDTWFSLTLSPSPSFPPSEKVAIKILDKSKLDQKTERLLSREIASMERLHHPHIIRLYEVIETLTRLHLVLEYAAGVS
uniref:non-specific serine/threonine protein kinase n=1 Tax=Callorhinchus milii TaxID=7868 RepID=A0A4W3GW17_CALMI